MPGTSFKHFMLVGIANALVFGLVISLRARGYDVKSTSELAAQDTTNKVLFGIGMTITALCVSAGVFGYLRQTTTIPLLFYQLFPIAVSMQIVTGWIPYTQSWRRIWHYVTSWIMAFSMLPLGAFLLVNSYELQGAGKRNLGPAGGGVGLILLFAMIVILMWGLMDSRKNAERLRAQQTYIILFMIMLLVRNYA